jgi:hypothetical protein
LCFTLFFWVILIGSAGRLSESEVPLWIPWFSCCVWFWPRILNSTTLWIKKTKLSDLSSSERSCHGG